MSLNQLPSDLLEDIAEFSLSGEMKGVSQEMRNAELAPRVIGSRKKHMDSLVPDWNDSIDAGFIAKELGQKATSSDVQYYIANSKGLLVYLELFISWSKMAIRAIQQDNLELLEWIIKTLSERLSEDIPRYDTQLHNIWEYVIKHKHFKLLDILLQYKAPNNMSIILSTYIVDRNILQSIFQKTNIVDKQIYIEYLVRQNMSLALDLYSDNPLDHEQLKSIIEQKLHNPTHYVYELSADKYRKFLHLI